MKDEGDKLTASRSQMDIDVVTVGRSDYGIYRPVLAMLDADKAFRLRLVVSGGHLDPRTKISMRDIESDGYEIAARIPLPHETGGPADIATGMAETMRGLAQLYRDQRPDIVMVLGDRHEMFAFTAALVPFNIPVAHIHGGELSFGAIDDVFRHAMTKMSHLHFAATEEYGRRIVRLGEAPWRVTVSGAPGLDTVRTRDLPDAAALEGRFGIDLSSPPLLVTFHPVTRQLESLDDQIASLLGALSKRSEPIVFTAPNLDSGQEKIREALADFVGARSNAWLVENFGLENYLAMLREAAACVGNSSSGLIETPMFELPVLNIGDRQDGRTRGQNVVDVTCETNAISGGLARILDPAFALSLKGMDNPYGDGHAARRIVAKLKSTPLDERLVAKRFYDGEVTL